MSVMRRASERAAQVRAREAPGAASLMSAAGRHRGQVARSVRGRRLLPSTLWQGIKYVKSFGPTSLSGANAEAGMKKGGNNSFFFFLQPGKAAAPPKAGPMIISPRLRHTWLRWRWPGRNWDLSPHSQCGCVIVLYCRERRTLRQHFTSWTFSARTR